jgi:hypothetical protein
VLPRPKPLRRLRRAGPCAASKRSLPPKLQSVRLRSFPLCALCPRFSGPPLLYLRNIVVYVNPVENLRAQIASGRYSEADILARRREMREVFVDLSSRLTEAEYDAALAQMTPQELENLRALFWDNPAQIEGFNRLRFSNIPNAPSVEVLEQYAFFFLALLASALTFFVENLKSASGCLASISSASSSPEWCPKRLAKFAISWLPLCAESTGNSFFGACSSEVSLLYWFLLSMQMYSL